MLAARRARTAGRAASAQSGSVAPASRSAFMIGTVRGSDAGQRGGVRLAAWPRAVGAARTARDVVALLRRHRFRPLGQGHVVDGEEQLRLAPDAWRRPCPPSHLRSVGHRLDRRRGVAALGEQVASRGQDRQPACVLQPPAGGSRRRRRGLLTDRAHDALRSNRSEAVSDRISRGMSWTSQLVVCASRGPAASTWAMQSLFEHLLEPRPERAASASPWSPSRPASPLPLHRHDQRGRGVLRAGGPPVLPGRRRDSSSCTPAASSTSRTASRTRSGSAATVARAVPGAHRAGRAARTSTTRSGCPRPSTGSRAPTD